MLSVATWNVNSLTVRHAQVLTWLAQHQPDILALQEIKMESARFPIKDFEQLGYHALVSGQKTYHGVAILSKKCANPDTITRHLPDFQQDEQKRVLGAAWDDFYLLNLYVPNGAAVGNEKYQYKLTWLSHLNHFLQTLSKKYKNIIVLGDFNIAPHDDDVHDPERWRDQLLVSAPERAAWQGLLDLGFVDCYRQSPDGDTPYSWWDYRQAAFRRNHGLRIDHIVASAALAQQLVWCRMDSAPRAVARPSDHIPVVAQFK